MEYQVGSIVQASYKSGEYVGEVVDVTRTKLAVKVLAVLKHPSQGDLHHPMEVDGVMFHQRRALAFQEIALMHPSTVMPYRKDVPEYHESLLRAVEDEMIMLEKMARWANQSIELLQQLQNEYKATTTTPSSNT